MNFKILDNNGNQTNCELLYTFKNQENNINYIIYTDGEKNSEGKLEILASRYEIVDGNYILKDIVDDSEWDLIDDFLNKVMN